MANLIEPDALVVAAEIEIDGSADVPPITMGVVPVTDATPETAFCVTFQVLLVKT